MLVEFAYSRVPFGGFGWTRIAYAAVDTPLAGFLPIIGVAGLSFVVAWSASWWRAVIVAAAGASRERRAGAARRCLVAVGLVVLLRPAGLRFYQVEPAETAAERSRSASSRATSPDAGSRRWAGPGR